MKWHHENVNVACLSTDEVHKAPGDPQDKLAPLKIFKTNSTENQAKKRGQKPGCHNKHLTEYNYHLNNLNA